MVKHIYENYIKKICVILFKYSMEFFISYLLNILYNRRFKLIYIFLFFRGIKKYKISSSPTIMVSLSYIIINYDISTI